MQSVEWIGWAASLILVLTLGRQVYSQWRSGAVEGVSRWLFIGQFAASVGFTIYSVLLKNWVFTATNSMLIVNALLGQWVCNHNRKRAERSGAGADVPSKPKVKVGDSPRAETPGY